MTASIHRFPAAHPAPPAMSFQPGDAVIIADYEWDAGEVKIPAIVTSHKGEWVGVRIPDVGCYSVHCSRVFPAPAPEAA